MFRNGCSPQIRLEVLNNILEASATELVQAPPNWGHTVDDFCHGYMIPITFEHNKPGASFVVTHGVRVCASYTKTLSLATVRREFVGWVVGNFLGLGIGLSQIGE